MARPAAAPLVALTLALTVAAVAAIDVYIVGSTVAAARFTPSSGVVGNTTFTACKQLCMQTAGCFSFLLDLGGSRCALDTNAATAFQPLVPSNWSTFDLIGCDKRRPQDSFLSVAAQQVLRCPILLACPAAGDVQLAANATARLVDGVAAQLVLAFNTSVCAWTIAPAAGALLSIAVEQFAIGRDAVLLVFFRNSTGPLLARVTQDSYLQHSIEVPGPAHVVLVPGVEGLTGGLAITVRQTAPLCLAGHEVIMQTFADGGTYCEPCWAGTTTLTPAARSNGPCVACPADSYSGQQTAGGTIGAAGACTRCPGNSSTDGVDQSSRAACRYTKVYLYNATAVPLAEAARRCYLLNADAAKLRATLATIETSEQNALLAANITAAAWIGLRVFTWMSGRPLLLNRLPATYPVADAVLLHANGSWSAEYNSSARHGFVCEYLTCGSGFFYSARKARCVPTAPCPPGTFQTQAATATSDTVCRAWSPCNTTAYETAAPTNTSDRVCAPRVCNFTAQYVDQALKTCAAVSANCSSPALEVVAPTRSNDRVCFNLTATLAAYISTPEKIFFSGVSSSLAGGRACMDVFDPNRGSCAGDALRTLSTASSPCFSISVPACLACSLLVTPTSTGALVQVFIAADNCTGIHGQAVQLGRCINGAAGVRPCSLVCA